MARVSLSVESWFDATPPPAVSGRRVKIHVRERALKERVGHWREMLSAAAT